MTDKEKEPKKLYDLPPTRFAWQRPDTGYYWERNAIGVKRSEWVRGWGTDWLDVREEVSPSKIWDNAHIDDFLVPSPNPNRIIEMHPMEAEPLLFQKFADLEPKDEAVLEFANKYGSLFPGFQPWRVPRVMNDDVDLLIKIPPLSRKQLNSIDVPEEAIDSIVAVVEGWKTSLNADDDAVEGESFSSWHYEMIKMSQAVQLFRWWKDKDTEALKEVYIWVTSDDGRRSIYNATDSNPYYFPVIDESDEIFKSIPPGDVLVPTLWEVTRSINRALHVHRVYTQLVLNDDSGKVEPFLIPESLLSAMWLQFHGWVIGERDFKICQVCGKWVDVTNKRQEWERESECAANIRARRSIINKKVAEARRSGEIDQRKAKEIETELPKAKTFAAMRAVDEKFKASLKPRKPVGKKTTKSPTKKAKPKAAKKPAGKKAARGGKK